MNSLEAGFPGAEFQGGLPAARAHQGLKQALAAAQSADKHALLWFADILRRKLYRELGYSSIQIYAGEALSFSPSKTSQFLRLAESLEELPVLKTAVARGEVSWTKARELVRVATPASEKAWVAEARRSSRRVLTAKVTRVKERARQERRRDPAQGSLGEGLSPQAAAGGAQPGIFPAAATDAQAAPGSAAWVPAQAGSAAPPCTVSFRLDGIQLARFDALMAQARRRGLKLSREELLLQALAAYIEGKPESGNPDCGPDQSENFTRVKSRAGNLGSGFSRVKSGPAQIILYKCKECGGGEVVTSQGRRAVSPSTLERIECDAQVQAHGEPNRATIPPSTRQAVLARDGHRCQIPGCGRTQLLEVHHVKPRRDGGSNQPENLISLCGLCHQLLHEKGLASRLLHQPVTPVPATRKGHPRGQP